MRRLALLAVTILIAAACLGMGFWQVGRLAARRETNARALAGRDLPPIEVDSSSRPTLRPHRRVVISGTLDPAHELVLRNHLVRGVPAVQIVTPLRIPGADSALLVNRGYVPAPDAVDPGGVQWDEPGERTFQGTLIPVPARGDGQPLTRNGRESWKSLDLPAIRARLPYPVYDVYLVAQPDPALGRAHTLAGKVYPFRAELPPMDEGPHLMYAVQWFGIAAAVLAFGALFILKGGLGAAAFRPETGETRRPGAD